MSKKINKTETVEEFLARGGKVTVVPPIQPENKELTVKSTVVTPPNILSYGEADQLYGRKKKRKKKKTAEISEADIACLPEELRKKLGL